jgi:type IV pilus assembly protein PilB
MDAKTPQVQWVVGLGDEEKGREEDDAPVDVRGDETSPAVGTVQRILDKAVAERASDVHLEPHPNGIRLRFRIDGVLHEEGSLPRAIQKPLVSRLKVLSRLDIAERRKPQDGKFQARLHGRTVDFRVSVLPLIYGEKVVLRVLDAAERPLELDRLGFVGPVLDDLRQALTSPHGLILLTGPTGSGKSTTLYSAVATLGTADKNIVTVEDPVEFALDGVSQVQVNPKGGVTFASALRAILRQDPDVILVGEIRDTETLEVAVKAALTGHLVLSTLHTNDAASAVTRMVDMGVDPFLVASSLRLVAAQRLARKLCRQCRAEISLPEEATRSLGLAPGVVGPFFEAKGCGSCAGGYRGRLAILETLVVTDEIRRLVVAGASDDKVRAVAIRSGMTTLRKAALEAAMRADTTLAEALRLTPADQKSAPAGLDGSGNDA